MHVKIACKLGIIYVDEILDALETKISKFKEKPQGLKIGKPPNKKWALNVLYTLN